MRWIVLLLIVLTPTTRAADAPTTAPAAVLTTAPVAPADLIRAAATPSAAVDAYARAVGVNGLSEAVQRAYLRRMVDFGMPEMAEAQAEELNRRGMPDGLSLGVTGYVAARRGEMSNAIAQLKLAVMQTPDDFVLRTAGQLVAWFDAQNDRSNLAKTDTEALEWMREAGKGKPAFADAYREAASNRQRQATATTPAATEPQDGAMATVEAPAYVEAPETAYSPYYYAQPYSYARPYSYAYPIYSSPIYTSPFCRPSHVGRYHGIGRYHGGIHRGGSFHNKPFVGPLPYYCPPNRGGGFVIGSGGSRFGTDRDGGHGQRDVVTRMNGGSAPALRAPPSRMGPATVSRRDDAGVRTSTRQPGPAPSDRSSGQPSQGSRFRETSGGGRGGGDRGGNRSTSGGSVTSSLGKRR